MPLSGRYGLHDYEKMFCPDRRRGQDIFDLRGIDLRAIFQQGHRDLDLAAMPSLLLPRKGSGSPRQNRRRS
jgi:hypothetical protein